MVRERRPMRALCVLRMRRAVPVTFCRDASFGRNILIATRPFNIVVGRYPSKTTILLMRKAHATSWIRNDCAWRPASCAILHESVAETLRRQTYCKVGNQFEQNSPAALQRHNPAPSASWATIVQPSPCLRVSMSTTIQFTILGM